MKMRPLTSATSIRRRLARSDQCSGFVEIGRNAEVAGEVIERAERQHDRAAVSVPGQRARRGADAAVPAADDQAVLRLDFGGVCGALGDVGPFDEFSLAADAVGGERGSKFLAQFIPCRRSGPAVAVNQDLRLGRAFRTGGRDQPPAVCGAMLNTANLCPSGSRK